MFKNMFKNMFANFFIKKPMKYNFRELSSQVQQALTYPI